MKKKRLIKLIFLIVFLIFLVIILNNANYKEIIYYEYNEVTITRLNIITFWELDEVRFYYGKLTEDQFAKEESFIYINTRLRSTGGYLLFNYNGTVELIRVVGIFDTEGNSDNFKLYGFRAANKFKSNIDYISWHDSAKYQFNIASIYSIYEIEERHRTKSTPNTQVIVKRLE